MLCTYFNLHIIKRYIKKKNTKDFYKTYFII